MPPRVRKRTRRRKRRNISSSASLSSSSEDETPPLPSKPPIPAIADGSVCHSDSDISASSLFASESPKDTNDAKLGSVKQSQRPYPSRSPTPPATALPTLIPSNSTIDTENEKEKALKEKFRKFWMSSIADGFKDDLEQIRKEPTMSSSRLSVFINALASGADVFSSVAQSGSKNPVNEVEVVMGSTSS